MMFSLFSLLFVVHLENPRHDAEDREPDDAPQAEEDGSCSMLGKKTTRFNSIIIHWRRGNDSSDGTIYRIEETLHIA